MGFFIKNRLPEIFEYEYGEEENDIFCTMNWFIINDIMICYGKQSCDGPLLITQFHGTLEWHFGRQFWAQYESHMNGAFSVCPEAWRNTLEWMTLPNCGRIILFCSAAVLKTSTYEHWFFNLKTPAKNWSV